VPNNVLCVICANDLMSVVINTDKVRVPPSEFAKQQRVLLAY
jgi:hypothetical protein